MADAVRFDTGDEGSVPGEWDEECWWTYGEAADVAGVSHRRLAEWIDGGQLPVRTGWREGAEIGLVRAGDVAALAPIVRDRSLPSRVDLDARAVFTGPRRSALGKEAGDDRSRALGDRRVSESDPASGPAADAEELGWVRELEREVERLREELDEMRVHRDELLDEVAVLFPLSGAASGGVGRHVLEDDRLRIVRESSGSPLWPTRRAWAALRVAALVCAVLWIGMLSSDALSADDDAVAAAAPRGATPNRVLASAVLPVDEPAVAVFAPATESAAGPFTESAAGPAQAAARPTGLLVTLPCRLLDLDRIARPATAGVVACVFGARVEGDAAVRFAIGPCIGALTADGTGVAGTHRVDGLAYCAHHAFVERVSSGFSNPTAAAALLAEAEQAERDGLVPALLVIRAERSAALFLRAALGTWSAAGLDGDEDPSTAGVSHAWTIVAGNAGDGALRLALTSWVRRMPEGDPRAFRLELNVTGEPAGDVLRSFDWLNQ